MGNLLDRFCIVCGIGKIWKDVIYDLKVNSKSHQAARSPPYLPAGFISEDALFMPFRMVA